MLKLIIITFAIATTGIAQITPGNTNYDADASLFFHLLERSPTYSISLKEYLKYGENNLIFKDFAEKALANKDIVEAIDGFRTGKIIWRKTNNTWSVVVVDNAYKSEYAEALIELDKLAPAQPAD